MWGAQVRCLVPNFRPEDVDNGGSGVIIEYAIRGSSESSYKSPEVRAKLHTQQPCEILHSVVEHLFSDAAQNPSRQPQKSFMDLGLDSLDMNTISEELSHAFGIGISPVVLFGYPSAEALIGYIRTVTQKPVQSIATS